jgi:hypothetical protein
MLQNTFGHGHPQDDFVYTEETWAPIRAILDELDRDADTLTIAQKTIGGQPHRMPLRSALESEACLYRMRAQVLPRLTAAKIRKGLKTAQDHAGGGHAHFDAIVRSRALWFNANDEAGGAALHAKLEEVLLPLSSEIRDYLAKQIEALRPYQNPSAAKPERDGYFEGLLEIWGKVEADAEEKHRLLVRFIRVAATPAMGIDVTSDAVRSWLQRQ